MQTFHVEIIKPSHYDKDGYVIQWWKAWIPSNSMASLYAISQDCAARKVLGQDVAIEVDAYDEMNIRIPVEKIAAKIRKPGHGGLVCLVGVQSNQFPRAMAIARQFRREGIDVAIGGFHVSGCISMLKELTPELKEAVDLGIVLFAGEAEVEFESFLKDVHGGRAKPLYNHMDALPNLQGTTIPYLPRRLVQRYDGVLSSFDAGRGCPFQCSFCTIINVQGRKSRWRDADDIERIVKENAKQGISRFFVTDDNFARNRNWEPIFDRMIELREEQGYSLHFLIQVDVLAHKIPNFIEKAARAGCRYVFIGLESINPENLVHMKKNQNRITEYRKMFQAWKEAGIVTYAGFIMGLPGDTPETIQSRHQDRPGGAAGRPPRVHDTDPASRLGRPPEAAREGRLDGPRSQQIRPRDRHGEAPPDEPGGMAADLSGHVDLVLHRRACRTHDEAQRRLRHQAGAHRALGPPGLRCAAFRGSASAAMRLFPPKGRAASAAPSCQACRLSLFHPIHGWQTLVKYARFGAYGLRLHRMRKRVQKDAAAKCYRDLATIPVVDAENETLQMFDLNQSSRAAVEKAKTQAQARRERERAA